LNQAVGLALANWTHKCSQHTRSIK
jgi:hypothetical protein